MWVWQSAKYYETMEDCLAMEGEGQIRTVTWTVKFELNLEGRVGIHQTYDSLEQDSRQRKKHVPRWARVCFGPGDHLDTFESICRHRVLVGEWQEMRTGSHNSSINLLSSVYHMPDTGLCTSYHVNFKITLRGRYYYYLYFTDKGTWIQWG